MGGEPEAQELELCTPFSADLLPLSSSTTLHRVMASEQPQPGVPPWAGRSWSLELGCCWWCKDRLCSGELL